MEEKLQALVKIANEIVDAKDEKTAIILLTQHKRVTCSVSGNSDTIGNMLYNIAKDNERFADVLFAVTNTLQENEEDQ